MTPGPLHGPLTFRAFLMTCTVEVELAGLISEVIVEPLPEPGWTVELRAGPRFLPPDQPALAGLPPASGRGLLNTQIIEAP